MVEKPSMCLSALFFHNLRLGTSFSCSFGTNCRSAAGFYALDFHSPPDPRCYMRSDMRGCLLGPVRTAAAVECSAFSRAVCAPQ